MKRSPSSTVLATGLVAMVLVAGACSVVDTPTAPDLGAPAVSPELATVMVTCQADRRAASLACQGVQGQPATGLSLAVLGGQGTYVQLASSNVLYDNSFEVFVADVTIKNLLTQALGTSDGSTSTGIKIFHIADPTVTSGSGSVSVANQDGNGTFTAANQPYFQYDEVLQTGGTSSPKTWAWSVPLSVNTFTFSVLVQADIPHAQSVLRWTAQNSMVAVQLNDVWAASASALFAVGDGGTIVHTTTGGTGWATQTSTVSENLGGVWGQSSSNVAAVGLSPLPGTTDARALHTTTSGGTWVDGDAGTSRSLFAVWGVSTTAFAVGGSGGAARIRVSTNGGSTYTSIGASNTNLGTQLNGVWAVSGTEAWAAGNGGTIVHSTTAATNNAVWGAQTSPLGAGVDLNGIWGVSATELWIVGNGGAILHTTDGGTNWQDQSGVTSSNFYGVWGSSATDIFAVGAGGVIAHYDGSTWISLTSGTTQDLRGAFGTSGTDVFVVGGNGTILHGTR